ncbi:Phosphotransferase enzyme family protein [Desulfocicer vacuolatum DSM 3385]|uniref:Phosphotransferase enzyme family protein n=1 Tax=Desulfocicer vacuolatum DSM 3385 TaxID=1121400 RepID=A0A1W2E3T8_9BACT|nr:sugar phosphate nucleotidyltransferase [Desulfocicer vacuolatum]SMD04062.1 Phosphotransferase enzyme family protein [Desulfocicer vacuolatum DSM 3385]
MKALILAAGLGTRLLPHTVQRPKPLFTLAGLPLLEITIEKLIHAGCKEIVINSHHLHGQIEAFIQAKKYPVPVITSHEPTLLDTGGAIKNVRDVMGDSHFWVINSDVVTDLDLTKVWNFHKKGDWPATLVLHHEPRFNGVKVNSDNFITGFPGTDAASPNPMGLLAFTGIQILSPEIFDHMPEEKIFSSIDLYKSLYSGGNRVKACVMDHFYWQDVGTPEAYLDAGLRQLFMAAGDTASGGHGSDNIEAIRHHNPPQDIAVTPLAGDGSDRKWFRLAHGDTTHVVADHGIDALGLYRKPPAPREVDAFVDIGNHLYKRQIPVPKILGYDLFSGLVILEDLGDVHLQNVILGADNPKTVLKYYKNACNLIMDFSIKGKQGFNPHWTHQTPTYSRELILENECRYFVDACLRGYLNLNIEFETLFPQFDFIAGQCLENAITGLMHRDMQSRNIMVSQDQLRIIDFQSARTGPMQYDVASLLIDPYVHLDRSIQETILDYCAKAVEKRTGFAEKKFKKGYYYCALTRNFQILGAFSNLSKNRGKTWFEPFIRPALKSLATAIHTVNIPDVNLLAKTIDQALKSIGE